MALVDRNSQIVADFDPVSLPIPSPRRTKLPRLAGKADAVIGMRRSGKTWLLFEDIHCLLNDGHSPGQVLYLNFEDERLPELSAQDIHLFIDAHVRRHPVALERGLNLYLDEVQNVAGWESFVRRMLDQRGTQIAITGSSARLLSTEIATSLRGRSLATELLPLSFTEVVDHAAIGVPVHWPPPERLAVRLVGMLRRYLSVGGFPEVQGLDAQLHARVLQDYVDVVVFRDVVERHDVTNVAALRYLVRRLLSNPAGRFSVNKLYDDLRSQGRAVSKDTLYAALGHLEDAFLLAAVGLDDPSEARRTVNPRKIYPIDPGLACAYSYSASRNIGHLLETVVYLELRRRGYSCGYGKTESGFEVDFVARQQGLADQELLQVALHLGDPTTRERELRALTAMMAERSVARGTVVTLDSAETITTSAGVIEVVPAWRWLLSGAN